MNQPGQSGETPEPAAFAQLIEAARNGDQGAVGQLIEDWRGYLLLIANQDLDRDIQAKVGPSDVVQESMLILQDRIGDFRGSSEPEFRAWIRQILKTNLEDSRRKYKQAQRRSVQREVRRDDSRLVGVDPAESRVTPGTDLAHRERVEILSRVMEELPENYRQVIELRNWQELGFREVAERMDSNEDAVRKLWYRAILKLQEKLNQNWPGLFRSGINPPES